MTDPMRFRKAATIAFALVLLAVAGCWTWLGMPLTPGGLLMGLSHRWVNFHGRVVDQYGTPVAGVEVAHDVARKSHPMASPSFDNDVSITDSEGNFDFSGRAYHFGTRWMKKAGYVFEKNGRSDFYAYPQDTADPGPPRTSRGNPHLYYAWKMEHPSALVQEVEAAELDLGKDGAFQPVPLPPPYDQLLQISFAASPGGRYGSWSLTLTVTGGGVRESRDRFMFEAPSSGYVEKWSVARIEGTPEFKTSDHRNFYFHGTDAAGKMVYGRLETSLVSYNSRLFYRYWINPDGSTRLLPAGEDQRKQPETDEFFF